MSNSVGIFQLFFKINYLILFFYFFIFSCESVEGIKSTRSEYLIPQHIKKIYLNEILDETGHRNIEPKLLLEIKNQFIADGRLEVVTTKELSDGFLDCRIVRYLLEPLSYDSNFIVEKEKLWVLLDLRFTDTKKDTVLWVEKRFSSDVVFNLLSNNATEPSSEIDAIEIIIKDLSKKIIKRTIEGWFAASGISDKK